MKQVLYRVTNNLTVLSVLTKQCMVKAIKHDFTGISSVRRAFPETIRNFQMDLKSAVNKKLT